jgi:hypothetical protein
LVWDVITIPGVGLAPMTLAPTVLDAAQAVAPLFQLVAIPASVAGPACTNGVHISWCITAVTACSSLDSRMDSSAIAHAMVVAHGRRELLSRMST